MLILLFVILGQSHLRVIQRSGEMKEEPDPSVLDEMPILRSHPLAPPTEGNSVKKGLGPRLFWIN